MARSTRSNPEEPTQFCLAIDTRTNQIVRIFGLRNGSYSLGGHTYANEHNNPLEAEIGLLHSYTSELQCFAMHLFNSPLAKETRTSW
jgi:hypothetical protein